MYFRQFLNEPSSCASYLLGCSSQEKFAVVDPHADLVDDYIAHAEGRAMPMVAVLETHVQADHVSGLPELVARTGATAYMPAGADVKFAHHPLDDNDVVELGNVVVQAIATPGHAPEHHAYLISDQTRADEPWLLLSGDSLLVGDVGRPDLHAHHDRTAEAMARTLYQSITDRLLSLPDHIALYPAHFGGSVCGRGLSSNPSSTVGFERLHNPALQFNSEDAFVAALLQDVPPTPDGQTEIIAANRLGGSPMTID